jgi:hypothetical protein
VNSRARRPDDDVIDRLRAREGPRAVEAARSSTDLSSPSNSRLPSPSPNRCRRYSWSADAAAAAPPAILRKARRFTNMSIDSSPYRCGVADRRLLPAGGVTHVKFSAASALPWPSYLATCG